MLTKVAYCRKAGLIALKNTKRSIARTNIIYLNTIGENATRLSAELIFCIRELCSSAVELCDRLSTFQRFRIRTIAAISVSLFHTTNRDPLFANTSNLFALCASGDESRRRTSGIFVVIANFAKTNRYAAVCERKRVVLFLGLEINEVHVRISCNEAAFRNYDLVETKVKAIFEKSRQTIVELILDVRNIVLRNVHEIVGAIDAVSAITVARKVRLKNFTASARLKAFLRACISWLKCHFIYILLLSLMVCDKAREQRLKSCF